MLPMALSKQHQSEADLTNTHLTINNRAQCPRYALCASADVVLSGHYGMNYILSPL